MERAHTHCGNLDEQVFADYCMLRYVDMGARLANYKYDDKDTYSVFGLQGNVITCW